MRPRWEQDIGGPGPTPKSAPTHDRSRGGPYAALMGPEGLREVAELSISKAHYLAGKLQEAGFKLRYPDAPFLWEFAVEMPDVGWANEALLENGIVGGLNLGDGAMLVAVTEKRTKEELDAFVEVVTNAG